MRTSTLSPDQVEKILMLYDKGVKMRTIQELMGVKKTLIVSTVYADKRKERYHENHNGFKTLTPEQLGRIETLYTFGYSMSEISEELSISDKQVREEVTTLRKDKKIKRKV